MSSTEFVTVPQPEEITRKERDDAMGSYLMMFASTGVGLPLPVINLIASVIYYFINRSKSPFVHFHALQSLLSQAPTTILNSSVIFWTFHNFIDRLEFTDAFWGYLLMVVIANVLYFIFSLVAAVYAYKGRMFYLLFFGKVAYYYAFRQRTEVTQSAPVNRPPNL